MKRPKIENSFTSKRLKLSHLFVGVAVLYLFVVSSKFTGLFVVVSPPREGESMGEKVKETMDISRPLLRSLYSESFDKKLSDNQSSEMVVVRSVGDGSVPVKRNSHRHGRITEEIQGRRNVEVKSSVLERMADEAWSLGMKAWEDVENVTTKEGVDGSIFEGKPEVCPTGLAMSGAELAAVGRLMFLPCGLAAGSSITVVGTPHLAKERLSRHGYSRVPVSQFMVEFQGLKTVDREDPPKILHFNPRLKGDWNHRPVIEHNTCYRMQWGVAQRCNGSPSEDGDDMLVDGFRRCEKWIGSDITDSKESKTTSWFKRFIGREQKPAVTWPFPFTEGKLFILTIRAGVDGYHMNIAGRHVTSFPYRVGFTLEDATGLAIDGNVDVHAVYATSLPNYHRSFSLKGVLEMLPKWKAQPLLKIPIRLFVGVLSASNHFAERMAIRKTWMQSHEVKSSDVVVRFFVALNPRKEVNSLLKDEASYFGDIVILPFMDRYELVVLKTIEICKYGVNITAAFIMKCDDDNFVRVDTVLNEIAGIPPGKALYMGNLNLLHRPLRSGKWAVNYEEWPEEVYPPYANGPGYIISSDIAKYVVQQHQNQTLRVFKMEDVSMGVWVEELNKSRMVQYSHSWKFCQYGCMEGYYTAHYQSPMQMVCLWDKLSRGHPTCCNFR